PRTVCDSATAAHPYFRALAGANSPARNRSRQRESVLTRETYMYSMKNRSGQRGFSLAEVLVATAILVVVLVGILTLYDRANRVFKAGNEAAEMQQNVRIAYERMVSDVRMAGFDYKRGGPLLPGQTAAPWATARPYSAGTIVT